MLGYNYYYNNSLKDYILIFGSLFDEIFVKKHDELGNQINELKIPISYGPVENFSSMVERRDMDSAGQSVSITLPRLSYEITHIAHDSSRKLNKRYEVVKVNPSSNNSVQTEFTPVPYNITFELSILTNTLTDGLVIVEQIVPFFTPEATIDLKSDNISDLNIPITLESISFNDNTGDSAVEERRVLIWTLEFTFKSFFFSPIRTKKIIKKPIINIKITTNDYETIQEIPYTATKNWSQLTITDENIQWLEEITIN